jgi:hypothetical protein
MTNALTGCEYLGSYSRNKHVRFGWSMTRESVEALSQLLGCYFHQDWPCEYGTDLEGLQSMVENEPRERIIKGVAEIDRFLATHRSETELCEIMTGAIGCYFNPSATGITYRDWLSRVRSILLNNGV